MNIKLFDKYVITSYAGCFILREDGLDVVFGENPQPFYNLSEALREIIRKELLRSEATTLAEVSNVVRTTRKQLDACLRVCEDVEQHVSGNTSEYKLLKHIADRVDKL